MYWVSWNQVLASHDKGGLDVGSLHAFNHGLLFKWIWRFVSQPNAIWVSVIQVLHGARAGIDLSPLQHKGVWFNIINTFCKAKDKGIIPNHILHFKVGDGRSIHFWLDNWRGVDALKNKYGRLFHLDTEANCLLADRCNDEGWKWSWNRDIRARNEALLNDLIGKLGNVVISHGTDSWHLCLDDDSDFTVSNTRAYIDDRLLPTTDVCTRWLKVLLRKINIFLWRLAMDRLPTRVNLARRGLEIEDTNCVSCNHNFESVQHVFFACSVASELWRRVRIWLDIHLPIFMDWSEVMPWFDSWQENEKTKQKVYVIFAALLWHVWRFRNSMIFPGEALKKSFLFDSICNFSFFMVFK
ncbi:uncharacterized protein [Rutidosis leptorrhynchoides]|uniref:uncharacterized protein n=1 Tax=Rutidosis leptorrhynchoides TaxID=125765 RepID=UPI003A9A03B0